jgi:hypothetical protein
VQKKTYRGKPRSEYQRDQMTREHPGGKHFFSYWQEHADNEDLPLWLRLAALAYCSHRKNGHATFFLNGESTLPKQLGKTKRHIHNEIKNAVACGFLAEGSNSCCLIIPDGITGGAEGNKFAECKHHR